MAKLLTVEDFVPYVGKVFSIAGRPETLTLAAAEAGRATPGLQRTPFSLVFAGPRDRLLPEGQYHFVAEGGPGFDLYVIPIVTAARERQNYEAVFN